jgi:putative FmdB family regulatory protein
MPLNDFKCPKCGLLEELITRSSDPAPRCPDAACEGVEMERQLALPAPAQFKGTGWYETDYRKKT